LRSRGRQLHRQSGPAARLGDRTLGRRHGRGRGDPRLAAACRILAGERRARPYPHPDRPCAGAGGRGSLGPCPAPHEAPMTPPLTRLSGHDVLFVMAARAEYGPHLQTRITPLITGVGPVEAAVVTASALTRLSLAGTPPDLVVSLG